jgi:O-antigen biosynthesis protein WbqP
MLQGLYRSRLKRACDVAGAILGLLALSPVFVFTAFAILIDDGRPILFCQLRVGKGGREFKLLKFRSMHRASPDVPSSGAARLAVTRVGRGIRRLNIDELPQLLNILGGTMSVVGPRPALPAQQDLIRLRLQNGSATLRPGLTGLAQVNAYSGMSVEEKAEWDGRYTERVTFLGDSKITGRTCLYLLKPPPVY